jgi:hypothetical protein
MWTIWISRKSCKVCRRSRGSSWGQCAFYCINQNSRSYYACRDGKLRRLGNKIDGIALDRRRTINIDYGSHFNIKRSSRITITCGWRVWECQIVSKILSSEALITWEKRDIKWVGHRILRNCSKIRRHCCLSWVKSSLGCSWSPRASWNGQRKLLSEIINLIS